MHLAPHIEQLVAKAFPILERQVGLAAVYLLGSALSGQQRDDSDIDLALMPANGCEIPLQERLSLAAQLEVTLARPIDLGVISPRNLIYAHEAILKGRRIATFDRNYTENVETRLLGSYLQLRQDRAEVEEAYHAA
jgi:predicted nucleotidyltransferase